MTVKEPAFRYHTEGPVPDNAVYVVRDADEELYEALARGEMCYVLGPPHSGKSSLLRRVAARLEARSVRTATLDLRRMSGRVSPEGFAYALIGQLSERFALPEPTNFFLQKERLQPMQRFATYLREEVLGCLTEPVVVFVDEVDAVRVLRGGAQEFAEALRGLHQGRAQETALRRLTFCLVGARPPGELLLPPPPLNSGPGVSNDVIPPSLELDEAQAALETPFPMARVIEPRDFSAREAEALLPGLSVSAPEAALQRVLHWTDGHPRLTLRLCAALSREGSGLQAVTEEDRVDQLVQRLLLSSSDQDPTLALATQRFGMSGPESVRLYALSLYRRLLFKERVPSRQTPGAATPVQRLAQLSLRLSGMIKEYADDKGMRWLRVRCRVFEQAFGGAWIDDKGQGRVLTDLLTRWLRSGKRPEHLLQGRELEEVLAWSTVGAQKTPEEEEFLRASLALRQEEELRQVREALAEEQRQGQEQRRRQRWERAALLSTLGAVALGGLAGIGLLRHKAERLTAEAQAARRDALGQAERTERVRLHGERAEKAAVHAVRRLLQARAATAGEGGAREPDADEAQVVVKQALRGEVPAEAPIDAVFAMVMAAQPPASGGAAAGAPQEGRLLALRAAVRAVGTWQRQGKAPSLIAQQALCGAVSEVLSAAPATAAATTLLKGHGAQLREAWPAADGRTVITVSDDQTGRLWEAQTGKQLAALVGHGGVVRAAAMAPKGRYAATVSDDRLGRLWSVPEGQLLATLAGHTTDVKAVAFAPAGDRLVTAGGDGTARLWTVPGGQPLAVLRGHKSDVVSVRFSPDGALVLTASLDRTAQLFDAASGRLLKTFAGHQAPLVGALFTPEGRRVLTFGQERALRLWNLDGTLLRTLEGHKDAVLAAALSADGRYALSAGQDRSARLWDLETGAQLQVLAGHQGPVYAVAFSPDGEQLLTAGQDRSARLWTRAGEPLCAYRHHGQAVVAASFLSDGQAVLTASLDRVARVLPATPAGVLSTACRMLKILSAPPDLSAPSAQSAPSSANGQASQNKPPPTLQPPPPQSEQAQREQAELAALCERQS